MKVSKFVVAAAVVFTTIGSASATEKQTLSNMPEAQFNAFSTIALCSVAFRKGADLLREDPQARENITLYAQTSEAILQLGIENPQEVQGLIDLNRKHFPDSKLTQIIKFCKGTVEEAVNKLVK